MRALSLFSGIGGLDVAAVSAGFEVVAQVEIEPYCRAILKKHTPKWWRNARQFKDIRQVTARQVGKVDLIFGGFPCQDISVAGKQAGIRDGERSGLYFELLRLIRELRPRAVILENVANITNAGLDIVSGTLAEIGYDCIWQTVRASDAGAPHQRERWFCVAIPNSAGERLQKRSLAGRAVKGGENLVKRFARCSNALGNRHGGRCQQRHTGKRSVQQLDAGCADMGNAKRRRQSGYTRRRSGAQFANRYASYPAVRRRTQSRLGRAAHGLSSRLDFPGFPSHPNEPQYGYEPPRVSPTRTQVKRTKRIHALGNAVVPQQAYPFFEAVYQFLLKRG